MQSLRLLPVLIVLGVGSVALARLAIEPGLVRIALVVPLALMLVAAALYSPRKALFALLVWVAALGSIRRLASGYSPGGVDPLLLIELLILGVLLAVAASRGAFRNRTALGTSVLVLSGLAILGALNPLQGSLIRGMAGLLFFLLPMFGFWVGRALCDDRMIENIFKLVAVLGVLAALYGLAQIFIGFPPWDSRWIEQVRQGYTSLFVYAINGDITPRPFASFSSASEYVSFLAVAIVSWIGFALNGRRRILITALVGVLLAALFYGSARAGIVALILALALALGTRRRLSFGLSIGIGVAALLVVPIAAGLFVPALSESSGARTLLAHQAQGLSDPLNPQASTFVSHLDLFTKGFSSLASNPMGVGISTISVPAQRFGSSSGLVITSTSDKTPSLGNTEADPSNIAVALGFPGLAAYLVLLVLALRATYRNARFRRDTISIIALGVVFVTSYQWLNGGHYAVSLLSWIVLGWIDRSNQRFQSETLR